MRNMVGLLNIGINRIIIISYTINYESLRKGKLDNSTFRCVIEENEDFKNRSVAQVCKCSHALL